MIWFPTQVYGSLTTLGYFLSVYKPQWKEHFSFCRTQVKILGLAVIGPVWVICPSSNQSLCLTKCCSDWTVPGHVNQSYRLGKVSLSLARPKSCAQSDLGFDGQEQPHLNSHGLSSQKVVLPQRKAGGLDPGQVKEGYALYCPLPLHTGLSFSCRHWMFGLWV